MTANMAPAAGRAIPGGALVALAIGLVLYLMTSLVLGSSGSSRVFDVSLNLPSLAAAPGAQPNVSGDPITGLRLMPAARTGLLMPAARTRLLMPAIPIAATVVVAQNVPAKPTAVTSKRSHYHDADERSHRLARRR